MFYNVLEKDIKTGKLTDMRLRRQFPYDSNVINL